VGELGEGTGEVVTKESGGEMERVGGGGLIKGKRSCRGRRRPKNSYSL